jgi:V/A-type H+-transporting ATPase subunit C
MLGQKLCFEIDYKKILVAGSIEEVMIALSETPYKKPILNGRNKFKEKDSVFFLEASVDIDYYERLYEAINKLSLPDRKAAKKIVGIIIDMENIRWLLRLRKYHAIGIGDILEWVVPGGGWIDKDTVKRFYSSDGLSKIVESVSLGPYAQIKDLVEKNIHLIEGLLYNILFSEIKKILSGFPFTIGTIIAYLVLKYRETRSIISLFYAKEYKLQKEEFQPLLNLNL